MTVTRCARTFVHLLLVGIAAIGAACSASPDESKVRAPAGAPGSEPLDGPLLPVGSACATVDFNGLDCSRMSCTPCEQRWDDARLSGALGPVNTLPLDLMHFYACFVGSSDAVSTLVNDPTCAGLTASESNSFCEPGSTKVIGCVDPLCPGGCGAGY